MTTNLRLSPPRAEPDALVEPPANDDELAAQAALDRTLFVLGLTVANGYEEDAGVCVGLCRQAWREGFLLTSALHEAAKRARAAAERLAEINGDSIADGDYVRWHQSIDVNSSMTWGTTPLHIASENGHTAVVAALLGAPGIAVNAAMTNGQTPLRLASENGHDAVVAALLASQSVAVNAADLDGWTPLHAAAACGHTAVVSALLAHPTVNVNPRTPGDEDSDAGQERRREDFTPLRLARIEGHADIAALLEARGGVE